jgi:hypothetical protein
MGTRSSRWTGAMCAGLTALAMLMPGAPVRAEMDHLTGYKVKDAAPKAVVPHFIQDYSGRNCILSKVMFFLAQSERDAADDPRGGPAGSFICYKAKCDSTMPTLPAQEDEHGTHPLTAKKVKIVCLPVDPCPGGQMVGGFCWVASAPGDNCDAACAAIGKACDPATITYAGSGGTLANCQAVYDAFPGTFGSVTDAACPASGGIGCSAVGFSPTRCTTPPTTCGANDVSGFGANRFCACQ